MMSSRDWSGGQDRSSTLKRYIADIFRRYVDVNAAVIPSHIMRFE